MALALGLLLPVFNANAVFGLDTIAYGAVNGFFAFSLSIMFTIVGKLLAMMVVMLDWVVNLRIYTNVPIIQEGWKIMRDFANMLFIIALIVMAYGTIFNIPGYDFRSLIKKFLIAALLINFSLVIGGLIIDATQVLNNTFLNAMGDIAGHLGNGLNPAQILPVGVGDISSSEAIANALAGSIVTLIFSVFLLFTFAVSVAVPLAVAFVRIPVLWALLIVSPMAWLLSILPATKKAYDSWWRHFLAWNLFLPYYLFFMYFALYFLSKKDAVLSGLGQDFVYSGLTGLQSNFTFGLLFYYVMVAVFMIGGTKAAMSAGRFSGTGIVNVAQWGRNKVANRIGWNAAIRAGKGRFEEIGEKEEARVSRQAAFMREGLGYVTGGRRGFVEEQRAKDIAEAKKRFDRVVDPAELRKLMEAKKGPIRDQLALREIMKERGLLRGGQYVDGKYVGDEYKETFEMYGGNGTVSGRQFAASMDYGKLNPDQRKAWLDSIVDVGTRRKIVDAMADKGDRYLTNEGMGAEQNLQNALKYYALEGDQRDLLKKIEKHNLELATQVGLQNGLLRKAGQVIENTPAGLRTAMEEVIRKMNPDALLEATRTLKDFAGKSTENKALVMSSLNQQKIEAMMAKGTQQQLEGWKTIDPDKFNEERIKAEKERVAREMAEITGRATGEAIARAGGLGGRQGGGGGQPPQGPPAAPAQPRRPAGFVRPGEVAQEGNVVDLRNRGGQGS